MNEPISVCIIVENLPVPADRRVWSEARALRDAGYSVSVICPKGKNRYTASFEILEGIQIHRHRAYEGCTPLGYLGEYLWALAAELYLVLKVFRRTKFRVLQGCNPPDTIFLLGLILRLFGVRFIFDHHDLAPELFEAKFGKKNRLLRAFTRLAEKCSFKMADVSIATNESFKDLAVSRGGKRLEHVFVVRNCPDLTTLRRVPARSDSKAGKPLAVVYVGMMAEQDGLDLLIDSIEQIVIRGNRQDTHFLLVGGGPLLPAMQSLATRKGLDAFVTFTGFVSHEEVIGYLSSADVGVAPDPKTPMNDNSTMIKVLEYMAVGLPMVLFDLKEGRRIAGSAALYAHPNDAVDFARQVSRLLDCSSLREQLGECGRKRVEDGLNWELEKRALLQAYSTVLQANQASAEPANERHRSQSGYLLK